MIDEKYSVVFSYVAKGGKPMVLQTPVAMGGSRKSSYMTTLATLLGAAALRGLAAGFSKIPKRLPQTTQKPLEPEVIKPPKSDAGRYREGLEKQNEELQGRLGQTEAQRDFGRTPLQTPMAPTYMPTKWAEVPEAKIKESIKRHIPITRSRFPKSVAAIQMPEVGKLAAPPAGTFKQAADTAKPKDLGETALTLPPDGKSDIKSLKTDVQHREKMGDK
jgi:hypothetical protein